MFTEVRREEAEEHTSRHEGSYSSTM